MKIMGYSTIIIITEFVAVESSFATKSINFDRIPKINSVATKLKVAFNIIVAEVTDPPPEGCTLVLIPFCDIGYIWDGKNFNPPVGS